MLVLRMVLSVVTNVNGFVIILLLVLMLSAFMVIMSVVVLLFIVMVWVMLWISVKWCSKRLTNAFCASCLDWRILRMSFFFFGLI